MLPLINNAPFSWFFLLFVGALRIGGVAFFFGVLKGKEIEVSFQKRQKLMCSVLGGVFSEQVARKWLSGHLRPYYAETITEWVAAKRDGWASVDFEFLLAFRTGVHCLRQERFKILDVKVNVNGCPVPVISTNIVGPHGRFGSR